MTFIEMDNRIKNLLNKIDPETGELVCDFKELEELQMSEEQKMDNCCLGLKQMDIDIAAAVAERKRLDDYIARLQKHRTGLAGFIQHRLNGEKRKKPQYEIGYKTTHDCVDYDMPEKDLKQFFISNNMFDVLTEKTDYSISKTAIKERIQSGEVIPHCTLSDHVSMIIK